MSTRPTGWVAAAVAVPAGLLGAVVAVAALVVHRDAVWLRDTMVPWGLVLAAAGSVLPSLALAEVGAGRAAVGAYGCGWCLLVLVLLGGRPEGDYLVAGDGRGWGFLVLASLGVVAATLRGLVGEVAPRRAGARDPDTLAGRRP